MAAAVLTWAYLSPMPFAWCRVFFGLRGHRTLPARWLLASALALVWPLYWVQFARWMQRPQPEPVTLADEAQRYLQTIK